MAALHVHDEHLKSLREALCRVSVGASATHVRRISEVIDEIDRHRPLGSDGKHGDRHTDTCGCDDK